MNRRWKQALAGAALAGCVAIGAGSAFAATAPSVPQHRWQTTDAGKAGPHHFPGFEWSTTAASYLGMTQAQVSAALRQGTTLSQLAQSHGKSVSGMETALLSAQQTRLNQAVQKGKLTSTQAQQMQAHMKSQVASMINRPLQPHGPHFGWNTAAASYLGMTQAQVSAALRQGTTLSQLAQSHGKSVSGLETALLSAEQTRLDQAVQKGKLTSARAQQMLAHMKSQVASMVNRPLMNRPFPPHGPNFGWNTAVASYLGMTQAQVSAALRQGTTLSQLAQSHGKSVSGLETALLSAEQSRLDQAVQKGKLTTARAQQILGHMKAQVTHMMDHSMPSHHAG